MSVIREVETYILIDDEPINCLIEYEFIEGDVEWNCDSICINRVVTLFDGAIIEYEDLPCNELDRLEGVCMKYYLKGQDRYYDI